MFRAANGLEEPIVTDAARWMKGCSRRTIPLTLDADSDGVVPNRGAINLTMELSEADREFLFLKAFSNAQKTPVLSYAFDAVSRAYDNSPMWSQWMGVALRDLRSIDPSSIDHLISENQRISSRTSDTAYQDSNYGGWSTSKATSFIGCQPDLYFGYVLDGDGVGYAMKFPKDLRKWAIPDWGTNCKFSYDLWGSSEFVFRIALSIQFDEPQDHAVYWERFETSATRLLKSAVPDVENTEMLCYLKLKKPYRCQIGRIELDLKIEYSDYPREIPNRFFSLRLKHLDNRSKIKTKLDELAGRSSPRPTRTGGGIYQSACLRNALLKLLDAR